MKKIWAKKWVKALRSGKYEQGMWYLKDENEYCCLGVLCTLTQYKNNYTRMNGFANKMVLKNRVLPEKVKELAGIKHCRGSINDNNKTSLATFNDSGKSFKWIANYIEKNWRKL